MRAFVLAGGLGTRLSPVLSDRPKPMALVGGTPFLEHLLDSLRRQGIREAVLLTGYRHESIEDHFRSGNGFGMRIRYSREMSLLGTGGALGQAFGAFTDSPEDVLIVNGDTFFDVDLQVLYEFHRDHGQILSMALKYVPNVARYGSVVLEQGHVSGFREKTGCSGEDGLINGGVCLADPSIAGYFPPGIAGSFEHDVLPRIVAEGRVFGLPFAGKFIDIGLPGDYARAQAEMPSWIKSTKGRAVFLDRDGTLTIDKSYTHRLEDLCFVEGAVEFLRRVAALGYQLFIVTNQSGVARGLYTERDVVAFMDALLAELGRRGVRVNGYAYCPYHREAVVPQYRRDSYLRKPRPGMILDLADRYSIDLGKSFMIGDAASDLIELPYLRSLLLPAEGRFEAVLNILEEGSHAV